MSLFKKSVPEEVFICERRLTCQVCGNNLFWRRKGQLNTAIASLFDFDWANPTAVCIICSKCGYIHWFMPQKD